jgi:ABC-2 type transport system ATP-binding protein
MENRESNVAGGGTGHPVRQVRPSAAAHSRPAPVIETRGLRKQFGDTVAVADLSVRVGAGEVFGFLGPNGAGKTTSIKMLLALVDPTSGSGQVLGAPLGDRDTRARIGFLPEHFRFHDTLTATELLRFHGRLFGLRGMALEARIDWLLTRVDMIEAAGRPLRGYSKGMLQRVGLAQALLNEPQLVFLDEPTSGLDPLGRLLVRNIIEELRAGGVTVFLNSHLLGEVEATCDRVAFVKKGRVVAEHSLHGPQDTVELELHVTPLELPLLQALSRFSPQVVQPRPGVVVLQTQSPTVPLIVAWLVQQGVQIYGVQPRRRSLEDLFLEVIGEDGRPG